MTDRIVRQHAQAHLQEVVPEHLPDDEVVDVNEEGDETHDHHHHPGPPGGAPAAHLEGEAYGQVSLQRHAHHHDHAEVGGEIEQEIDKPARAVTQSLVTWKLAHEEEDVDDLHEGVTDAEGGQVDGGGSSGQLGGHQQHPDGHQVARDT